MKILICAILAAVLVAPAAAEARHRSGAPIAASGFPPSLFRPAWLASGGSAAGPAHARAVPRRHVRSGSAKKRTVGAYSGGVQPSNGRVSGLVPGLAVKVAEIVQTCGSRLISGVRHTFVAGTRTISLHASGRAADVAGNAPCIYSLLAGWPGGYSIDYGAVGHVHISLGGREDGARFRHGGHHRHRHHRRRRAW